MSVFKLINPVRAWDEFIMERLFKQRTGAGLRVVSDNSKSRLKSEQAINDSSR
jgi:hypothetical protein